METFRAEELKHKASVLRGKLKAHQANINKLVATNADCYVDSGRHCMDLGLKIYATKQRLLTTVTSLSPQSMKTLTMSCACFTVNQSGLSLLPTHHAESAPNH